ncbi:flavin reductase family protein [Anaeroselena agilis]|uniref:Flavin reductase family protein n=1 Tax=Anaeroselena agilis TaxID=3063788 RepID=A0ABU3NSM6_9FIRM|nr:flavin reductase family protein [Selenomonadales bacterium 4137-cl]
MKKSLGALTPAMPLPVWVIGSYGGDGAPCLMTAAWCGVCCSEPPCVAVAVRNSRLTHANIAARGAFTVNISSERYAAETDYCGLVSGRDTDKFAATGLTAVGSELVDAPYIEEFPLVLECSVQKTVELGSHTLFIGRVVDAKADTAVLGENGMPDMARVKPLACSPADRNYYAVGRLLGGTYSLGRGLTGKKTDDNNKERG